MNASGQRGQGLVEFALVLPVLLSAAFLTMEATRLAAFKIVLDASAETLAAEVATLQLSEGWGLPGRDAPFPAESAHDPTKIHLEKFLGSLTFLSAQPQELGTGAKKIHSILSVNPATSGAVRVTLSACLPLLVLTMKSMEPSPHELSREPQANRDCFGAFRTQGSGFRWGYWVVKAEAVAAKHASVSLFAEGLATPEKMSGLSPIVNDVLARTEQEGNDAWIRTVGALQNPTTLEKALAEVSLEK